MTTKTLEQVQKGLKDELKGFWNNHKKIKMAHFNDTGYADVVIKENTKWRTKRARFLVMEVGYTDYTLNEVFGKYSDFIKKCSEMDVD